MPGYVDTNRAGTYKLVYSVSDSQGLSARNVTRTVTVFEVIKATGKNTAPTVKLVGSSMVLPLRGEFIDPGVIATDKEDGDITSRVEYDSNVDTSRAGTYKVVYWVYDSEGMKSSMVTRVVSVNGNKAPTIKLNGANQIQLKLGSIYNDPGFTATDVEDGDLTADVVVSGDVVNTNVAKTYRVNYTVTDSDGASSKTMTRFVVVAP